MSGNGLNREGFLAARDTIAALKGTVECLQVNLSQERDANEGLNLTIESLRGENGSLQEKTFQLEAELDALKQEMKDEKQSEKTGNCSAGIGGSPGVGKEAGFLL